MAAHRLGDERVVGVGVAPGDGTVPGERKQNRVPNRPACRREPLQPLVSDQVQQRGRRHEISSGHELQPLPVQLAGDALHPSHPGHGDGRTCRPL